MTLIQNAVIIGTDYQGGHFQMALSGNVQFEVEREAEYIGSFQSLTLAEVEVHYTVTIESDEMTSTYRPGSSSAEQTGPEAICV